MGVERAGPLSVRVLQMCSPVGLALVAASAASSSRPAAAGEGAAAGNAAEGSGSSQSGCSLQTRGGSIDAYCWLLMVSDGY